MTINPQLPITFSRTHRLQWEEAQQKDVILYPEGMVELNQSSAEILKLCDGSRNLAQIVRELELKFATSGLINDITAFLEVALKNGWIQQN
jgi:pyrroloquinoline quinone biosynthesis protein D